MGRPSPLKFRQHARTPVEFPAARFSTFSIRWALVIEEGTVAVQQPGILPTPAPSPIPPVPEPNNWDWGYIALMYTASMDWGLITTDPTPPNLDFGFLPDV